MFRVGIVGAGGMGNVHARQYRKRSDIELFVFDRNDDRRHVLMERFDVRPVATLEALIEQVDVIDVCLPTPYHTDAVLKAVAAGRAVMVEKPLALTVEEAVQIAEAVAKAKVPLMPAHVVRYFPEYAAAHRAVERGDIGTPAAARTHRGGGAPSGSDGWFMDLSKSGGVLLDLCIHDFDWLRWTVGEVKFLYSRSIGHKAGHTPDYASTTLTFENGCVANVTGTWMDPGGFRVGFEIAGSGGLIQHDGRDNVALRTTVAGPKAEGAPLPSLENGLSDLEDPYYLEIDAFLEAVKNGTTPPITAVDGLHAVAIATAAIESAKTDQVVTPARHF